jgi:hypothetical protein
LPQQQPRRPPRGIAWSVRIVAQGEADAYFLSMRRASAILSLVAAGILIGALISPLGGSGATTTSTQPVPVAPSPGVGTFPMSDRAAPFAAGHYCEPSSKDISGRLLAYGLTCRAAREELRAWANSPRPSGFIHGFRCVQSTGGRTHSFRCVQTRGIQFVSAK